MKTNTEKQDHAIQTLRLAEREARQEYEAAFDMFKRAQAWVAYQAGEWADEAESVACDIRAWVDEKTWNGSLDDPGVLTEEGLNEQNILCFGAYTWSAWEELVAAKAEREQAEMKLKTILDQINTAKAR